MKKLKYFALLAFSFFLVNPAWSEPPQLKIGTDQNYWYPFSYASEGKARGLHIDIAAQALTNLGYSFTFIPRPWKRSLKEAENGQTDAIVSASYKPERAKYLFYPEDAATEAKSQWRIMQAEYVIISPEKSTYKFKGDLSTLPAPVRAPLGYSIVQDLMAQGIDVATEPDIRESMLQLVRSQRGVVVTAAQNALHLMNDPQFSNKVWIQDKPFKSKSYFMVFAKTNQKLNPTEIQQIWDEIKRLREDEEYLNQLFSRY